MQTMHHSHIHGRLRLYLCKQCVMPLAQTRHLLLYFQTLQQKMTIAMTFSR